ncbi:MAG: hypothetical protein Q9176_005008 [Flavoplaca citrina]
MEGLRHRQRMRDLSSVHPALSSLVHDQHLLEYSPTATPAHTRSASPLRGTVMPHSSREAAEFVSKLNDITEVREADDAFSFRVDPKIRTKEDLYFLASNETTTNNETPNTHAYGGRRDSTDLIAEDEELDGMAQVSSIDGSASVTVASKVQVLLIYFAFNLGLTLYNKAVMIKTVRALTPVFTVAIYRIVFRGIYGTDTYISLVPVIMGVMLASYGDLNATILGFVMTMLGTILAAVKTVTTNRLQTAGLHLGALELLYRMSPIACIQSLAVAYICGELDSFDVSTLSSQSLLILLVNGTIAFGLNVASFEANKRSGALTMTIAANVKQVLTVVLSVALWHIPVGAMNTCGIALTMLGGAWYGRVELVGKTMKKEENRLEEGVGKV